jgi:hypothetical protein
VEDDDNEEEELEGRALTREAGDGNHDSEEEEEEDDDDAWTTTTTSVTSISSGSFCPRARRVLLPAPVPLDDDGGGGDARDDGDVGIAPGILPRISALLGHPSADPAGAAFSRDAPEAEDDRGRSSSSSSDDVVGTTIASLLSLLRTDARIAACRDLLDLSDDLGVLDAGRLRCALRSRYHEGRRRRPPREGWDGRGRRRRGRRVEDYYERKSGGGETRRVLRRGGDARDDATANSTIQEYVGEVIDETTKNDRLLEWARDHPNDPNFYVMRLETGWYIDARGG